VPQKSLLRSTGGWKPAPGRIPPPGASPSCGGTLAELGDHDLPVRLAIGWTSSRWVPAPTICPSSSTMIWSACMIVLTGAGPRMRTAPWPRLGLESRTQAGIGRRRPRRRSSRRRGKDGARAPDERPRDSDKPLALSSRDIGTTLVDGSLERAGHGGDRSRVPGRRRAACQSSRQTRPGFPNRRLLATVPLNRKAVCGTSPIDLHSASSSCSRTSTSCTSTEPDVASEEPRDQVEQRGLALPVPPMMAARARQSAV